MISIRKPGHENKYGIQELGGKNQELTRDAQASHPYAD